VIVVSRFEVPEGQAASFLPGARHALDSLAQRAGFVRGHLGRAADEPSTWALVTEWDDVGSYRRGLSAYDVKLATAPLMELSVPEPSAYEVVATVEGSRPPPAPPSQRAR
jgi:heme-degrading monooxygenase HmoA